MNTKIFAGQTLADVRAHYEEEGWAVVRGVIDQNLVEEARQHVDWLLERNPGTRPEQLHHTLIPNDPFWVRLVSDDRLLDVVEQLIGPNIALFASHYICKRPRDGQAVLWHQDGSYWPLEPMEVITIWLALDTCTPENGCMRVIPGTHKEALHAVHERHDVDNVLQSGMDETLVDESKAVDVILGPGDVSIHHPNVVHGSEGNTSDRWRRGLTIRYIPTSTEVTEKNWPSVMLLRGTPKPGVYNNYVPFPRYREGEHFPFAGCERWPW